MKPVAFVFFMEAAMDNDKNPLEMFGGLILIVLGIVSIFFSFRVFSGNLYFNYGLLAVGVLLVISALVFRKQGMMGMALAGIWLMAMGFLNLYDIRFIYDTMILAVLPIVAGILLLFNI
jgi:hypothetical protein